MLGALSRGRSRLEEYPRQRDFLRADQDAGRVRHRGFSLHPEMERIQHAAAAERDAGRYRQGRRLFSLRSGERRDRRSASRRRRLSCRRHQESRRAGYDGRRGLTGRSVMPAPVVYYVRHGETDWNVEWRLQGGRDIALNERGREQANRCGEILRDLMTRDNRAPDTLDYVSSPLGRARVTMELVRGRLGLPAEGYRVEQNLTEISFGEWEGFTIEELSRRDNESVLRRDKDKWNFLPPGGESYQQVMVRIAGWYATLARDAVVVAHG